MFISVITANFNGGAYLKEAIESVLNQDFDDFEYIIVDDGSTDDSKDIIGGFISQYNDILKPIFQSTNCGQGECFNTAISTSKGSILCFLDSDDFWFKDKLTRVHDRFLSCTNLAIYQHNLQIVRGNVITEDKFSDILVTGDYFSDTVKSRKVPWFTPTSGLSFRKEILDKVLPIPKTFITCADGYLTRTCFCYGEVVAENECLGAYRIHGKNSTFDNPNFSGSSYKYGLLVPALNDFYRKNNIDLRYSKRGLLEKLFDISPQKFLKAVMPQNLFERFEKYIDS